MQTDNEKGSDDEENVSFKIPVPPTPPRPSSAAIFSTPPSGYVPSSNQYALIDSSGICSSCNDASALKASLVCLLCSHKFHAVCTNVDGDKTGNEVICARTFYGSFMKASNGVYSKRPGNFVFICDSCMTSFEHSQSATKEDKIDKMGSRVDNLSQNVDQIKSLLLDLTSKSNSSSIIGNINENSSSKATAESNDITSYKNALMQNTKSRSVLIVQNNKASEENIDNIIIDNGIHVEKTVKKDSGNSVFVCPTQEDRDKLSAKLSEVYPEMKTKQPPDLLPTISVANLSVKYQENQLKEIILKEHRDIKFIVDQGEKFEVLAVRPQKKDSTKFQATLRTGNCIRKIIKNQGDRLYIGSSSNPVYDTFHVKRCNKCQKFNHYHSDCNANVHTCGFCSEIHDSQSCPHKSLQNFVPKCSNCSGKGTECESHTAFDVTCPSYKAEQEKRRKMISFYNQKN